MNNFEALKQYMIPTSNLNNMLEVYKNIGQNKYLEEELGDQLNYLFEQGLERDTFFLASLTNINLSENRMRLLITKNSHPVNSEEKRLVEIKEVLRLIRKEAKDHTFNGSDILQYLNRIFGKNSHKFTPRNFGDLTGDKKAHKTMSIRLSFEKMLEEYHLHFNKNTFEKLYLSITAYLEMDLMKPYTDHNDIASLLALYYMLFRTGVDSFKYISFFELYLNEKENWESEKKLSYINFPTSHLRQNGLTNILFEIIKRSYEALKDIIKTNKFDKRMFKGDGIEQTILIMPSTFSKEDIRKYHPNVSDSTINRALFKLRDENIIAPLGKGRSARWVKLISDDDPRKIFGVDYEK